MISTQPKETDMTDLRLENEMEIVTNNCQVCNKHTIMVVNIAEFNAWRGGLLIQQAFPTMSQPDRELLISGTHPDCWDSLFSEEDN
jgi:hypothetical protein